MNSYERLCAFIKVVYENIFVLHHNLVGGNWFSDHERLGDFYEKIGGYADTLIEAGLMIGYREPSISEAVLQFSGDVIPAVDRDAKESYRIVYEAFRSIAGMIDEAKSIVPPDVANKLEEISFDLNILANYQIARYLEIGAAANEDDED